MTGTTESAPRRPKTLLFIGVAAVLGLIAIVAIGSWTVFESSRPIVIEPLKAIPAKWNLPPNKKLEDLSEFYVQYKLTGELPGKPGDQFHLVVEGPQATPYMRILYGDELQKGGEIGLAVPKKGAMYTASVRGYGPEGNGPRYSNTLRFKF